MTGPAGGGLDPENVKDDLAVANRAVPATRDDPPAERARHGRSRRCECRNGRAPVSISFVPHMERAMNFVLYVRTPWPYVRDQLAAPSDRRQRTMARDRKDYWSPASCCAPGDTDAWRKA